MIVVWLLLFIVYVHSSAQYKIKEQWGWCVFCAVFAMFSGANTIEELQMILA